jgi:glutathione S-transferase
MLTVHHLNDSRSQRVLWLLEELELPYKIVHYQRDAVTRLAPPELQAVHPLGKSPVLSDKGATIIESGAIIDFVLRHYAQGRLRPNESSAEFDQLQQWMHYAEGSAMLPLMLRLYVGRLGDAGAPLSPRINSEIANHLGYVNNADIQMSFVGEAARQARAQFPHMDAWVRRFQARPAYQRALEKGGPYALAS